MTRTWWRHPALGLLALLLVVMGIAYGIWGVLNPGRLGGEEAMLVYALATVMSGYLMLCWLLPLAVGRAQPDTAQRVAQVRASGALQASAWCSARVGLLSFRGPLLRVSVYPGGIVLQPRLIASRAILASDLIAVEDAGPVMGWFGPASVVVKHTAPDVRATVRLHIERGGQLATAIRSLRPGDTFAASDAQGR